MRVEEESTDGACTIPMFALRRSGWLLPVTDVEVAGIEGVRRVSQVTQAAYPKSAGGRADVRQPPEPPESVLRLAATDSALGCACREVRRVVDAWGLWQGADVVELLALE